ncbi:MAG: orotidine 5'-phosphate decarboxylase [Candidatus Diapherotrites archaeon]|nr:orotidine 5'-phosphate decarboxylase [Candidatus Diapherotrites archaeon]
MAIIKIPRSVIPACDVASIERFEEIVKATGDIEKIGAYKIGFELGLKFGLPKIVETARQHTEKPIIYDHQKAGTDIPDTAAGFAETCKDSGVDAVILFPQSGPETEKAWIKTMQAHNLGVIVGGEMTHKSYLESDNGFILNAAPKRMYEIAAGLGVTDFVVPGNKPEKIEFYKLLLKNLGLDPTFYSPGLVAQGGKISESAKAAGNNWHAIVGRGIYKAEDIKQAALELVKEF